MSDVASSIHLILVDDDPGFVELAAEFLERKDDRLVVETETDPTEALETIAENGYDCVVSDYDMPQLNGIEVLQRVREEFPELPFILFTGKGSEEVASEAISAGVTDYLQKESGTSQYAVLANRVLNAVESYQAQQRSIQLQRIRNLIRDINQALVRAPDQATVEAEVCELIAESDPYLFAWIGEHDADQQTVEARAAAGLDEGYLDTIEITTNESATGQGPTGQAVRNRELAVMQNIPEQPEYEPWRAAALERGYLSSAAIPLVHDDTLYGVLNVYADRPNAFDQQEQALLAEVGEDLAHAIHSQELKRDLRMTRRAVETAGHAIYWTDADGTIEYVNPGFEVITGYSADEAIGRNPRILQSGEHDDAFYEDLWETILAGDVWEGEVVNQRKDGEQYTIKQTISPILDESGEPAHFVAVNASITEQKERERELEQYERILEHTPVGIFRLDEGLRIVYENPRAEAIVGVPEDETASAAIGEDIRDLPSIVEAGAAEPFDRLAEGERISLEFEFTSIYDKQTHLRGEGVPLLREGDFDGAVVLVEDMTEQIEREQSFRDERDRIRALFENSSAAIAEYEFRDGESVVIEINPAFERTFGCDTVAVQGQTLDELVVPDEYTAEGESINNRVHAGEIVDIDVDRQAADGLRTFNLRSVPLTPGERSDRGFAIYTDISARKERERELERYRTLVETVGDPMYLLDAEGRIGMVNRAMSESLGATPENLVGLHASDVMGEGDFERGTDLLQQLLRDENRDWGTYEVTVVPVSGERYPAEINLGPIQDADGEYRGSTGVVRDLTERKAHERELERYATIVKASGDPIYTLDEVGRCTSANTALTELAGYDEEALIGVPVSKVMEQAHVKRGETLIRSLLTTDAERGTFEMDLITADGDHVPCENHVALLPFEEDFRGTVGVLRDISDRLQRERELQRERDRLDEFAGVVSHDLRNPLNVIGGRLDLAREDCDSDHLDPAVQATKHMELLIANLLELARAGEAIDEPEPVELPVLVAECWAGVETSAARLVTDTETLAHADRTRLRQLLENLFRNAVEHGGADVTVTVGDLPDGFYIEDTGPGISEDDREQVFEAGHTTSDDGTGLGLSIVTEIAEAHGWSVRITSGAEGGARFEITGVETGDT